MKRHTVANQKRSLAFPIAHSSKSKMPHSTAEQGEKMTDSLLHLNDAEFDTKVLESKMPVLVDFWAPWCGPCRMIAPILQDLARDYKGRVIIAKVNTDDNPMTPNSYGIRSIPTLILFKNGQIEEKIVGLRPKEALKAMLDKALT
jgi:thioredoxin 1